MGYAKRIRQRQQQRRGAILLPSLTRARGTPTAGTAGAPRTWRERQRQAAMECDLWIDDKCCNISSQGLFICNAKPDGGACTAGVDCPPRFEDRVREVISEMVSVPGAVLRAATNGVGRLLRRKKRGRLSVGRHTKTRWATETTWIPAAQGRVATGLRVRGPVDAGQTTRGIFQIAQVAGSSSSPSRRTGGATRFEQRAAGSPAGSLAVGRSLLGEVMSTVPGHSGAPRRTRRSDSFGARPSAAARKSPIQQQLAAIGSTQGIVGCIWIKEACCKQMTSGLWRCTWPGGACTPGLEPCPAWLVQAIYALSPPVRRFAALDPQRALGLTQQMAREQTPGMLGALAFGRLEHYDPTVEY